MKDIPYTLYSDSLCRFEMYIKRIKELKSGKLVTQPYYKFKIYCENAIMESHRLIEKLISC